MHPLADESRTNDWDDDWDDREGEPTDVISKRVGAFLVDLTICVLALVVPLLVFGATFSSRAFESRSPDISRADGDIAVFARDRAIVFANDELYLTAALAGLVALLVFVILPAFTGASPGKAVGDIRVVKRDGKRPGLLRSLVRTLLWIIDGLPGIPLVGYLFARVTRHHQRVGDLVARTYVVDKAHRGHPIDEPRPDTETGRSDWMEGAEPATARPAAAGVSVFGEADPAVLDREPGVGEDATAPAASAWAPAAAAATAASEPEAEPSPEPTEAEPEPESTEAEPEPAERSPEPAQADTAFKADEPVWDQRRRTYIMYDSRRSAWLGWDDTANEWRRLGGGGDA